MWYQQQVRVVVVLVLQRYKEEVVNTTHLYIKKTTHTHTHTPVSV